MSRKKGNAGGARQSVVRRMTAGISEPETATVKFANDDVPEYLKHVKKLKERSLQRPAIVVK